MEGRKQREESAKPKWRMEAEEEVEAAKAAAKEEAAAKKAEAEAAKAAAKAEEDRLMLERRLAQDAEIAKLKEEVFASADKQAITDDGEQPIFRESYTGARAPVGAPAPF